MPFLDKPKHQKNVDLEKKIFELFVFKLLQEPDDFVVLLDQDNE